MIDAPESGNDSSQISSDLQDGRTAPKSSDTANSGEELKDSDEKRNYSQHIVRLLKAMRRGIVVGVDWLDKNDGAITAIATVLIMALTALYVHYAKVQWKAMKDQIAEMQGSGRQTDQLISLYRQQVEQLKAQVNSFQRVEGAYIGIDQPQGTISGKGLGIPLENYGRIPSPRVWIYPHIYRFTSKSHQRVYSKDYSFGGDQTEIPPGRGRYGITVPLELIPGELNRIQTGDEIMWLAVSFKYDDGFGNVSLMKGACFIYNPTRPTVWDACPTFDFAHLPK